MAMIKNIGGADFRVSAPIKRPVKEKWERVKRFFSYRLNEWSKGWDGKHKKYFLWIFCSGFSLMLGLSFFIFHIPRSLERVITVPTLPGKSISAGKAVLNTIPQPPPGNFLPVVPDTLR